MKIWLLLIIAVMSATLSAAASSSGREFVVVLDPGHGGKDYGAIGKLTNEKTINLDVALRLKKLLEKEKDVKVVMTRSTDRFISLQKRADIANKAKGDLFISIHVNSVAKKNKNRTSIAGASVYALGLHRTAENLEVAKRENSVIALEADHSTVYQGFDPNSTESYIIFELNQNRHLASSLLFAQAAQCELTTTGARRDKGVRQAGFWVLMATGMPAVLVELDFICNPVSEKFMNSDKGKDKLAKSLANAFKAYREGYTPSELPESAVVTDSQDDDEEESAPAATSPVTYKIQFMACDKKLKSGSREFKKLKNVESYRQGKLYKYTVGNYSSEAEAEKQLPKVKQKFPQAFIIKWRDGKRVE